MSDLRTGTLVRFAHEMNGGPVHRIVSVMRDGMVEIHDMGGYFAPHLFVVADDVGDIPPVRPADTDLLPCPFCGGAAERIDVPGDDGTENAGGSCIQCNRCAASGALHFDRKENLLSSWNQRADLGTGLTLDGKAIALFRAWGDRIPDPVEAFEAWEGMSMADQGEWRRRVIEYEAILADRETT